MKQTDLNLNTPLDHEAKPTLARKPLAPSLASAAATLQGDYFVQLQLKLNQYLFWNRFTKTVMVMLFQLVVMYSLWDYISVSDSVGEFLMFFTRGSVWRDLFIIFPTALGIVLCVGLVIWIISDEFKHLTKNFIDSGYVNEMFGFDLVKYANLDDDAHGPKHRQQLKNGDNTQIITYRDSPIAIATVVPDPKSSVEDFVVLLQGLSVRKVYSKVDFDQLVLEWSIIRARQLLQQKADQEKVKLVSGCRISVLVDAYSWDNTRIELLKKNGFQKVGSSFRLNPFLTQQPGNVQILTQKFFGVARETYGLQFTVDNEDADLLKKASKSSGFIAADLKKRK